MSGRFTGEEKLKNNSRSPPYEPKLELPDFDDFDFVHFDDLHLMMCDFDIYAFWAF